jgi:hypothetical protein
MNVNVAIQQWEGEGPLPLTADEIASDILELIGGDSTKDICHVSIMSSPITAQVGSPPLPPEIPPADNGS